MTSKKEDLSVLIASKLNNNKTKETIATFLDDDTIAVNVKKWVESGSTSLDLAVSNRPYGGYPVGRLVEITGLEATGKSLLAAHALVKTQLAGGVAVFIDTEQAVSRDFLRAIGVDLSSLIYIEVDKIEEALAHIDKILEVMATTLLKNKDAFATIVLDSIAGASTTNELDSGTGKDGYNTEKAIIMSKALRKLTRKLGRTNTLLIFTNQLRQKMNVMPFADPWASPAGKATAFHASIRIRLKSIGKIYSKDEFGNKEVVGITTVAQVVKNRIGPPFRSAEFDIFFSSGIDNFGGWLATLKKYKIIKDLGKKQYKYVDTETNEEIEFTSKTFLSDVLNDERRKSNIYQEVCNRYIMKYEANENVDIDTVEKESLNNAENTAELTDE